LAQIQYIERDRCGHYPWLKEAVREEFVDVLRDWLTHHLSTATDQPSNDRVIVGSLGRTDPSSQT
jgi:hypothetical protein